MDMVVLVQEFSVRVRKIHIMFSCFFDSAYKYWMGMYTYSLYILRCTSKKLCQKI